MIIIMIRILVIVAPYGAAKEKIKRCEASFSVPQCKLSLIIAVWLAVWLAVALLWLAPSTGGVN